jgi:hypothetical protein
LVEVEVVAEKTRVVEALGAVGRTKAEAAAVQANKVVRTRIF